MAGGDAAIAFILKGANDCALRIVLLDLCLYNRDRTCVSRCADGLPPSTVTKPVFEAKAESLGIQFLQLVPFAE